MKPRIACQIHLAIILRRGYFITLAISFYLHLYLWFVYLCMCVFLYFCICVFLYLCICVFASAKMFWWHFLQRRGLKYPPSRNIAIGIQTVETSDKFGKRMGNNIFWQGKLFSRYFSKNRFSHLQFFLRLSSFEKIVGVYCYFAHYKYLYEQMYTRTLGRLWSCLTSSFAPSGFLENLVILSGSALALFVPEIWGKSKKSIFFTNLKSSFHPRDIAIQLFCDRRTKEQQTRRICL